MHPLFGGSPPPGVGGVLDPVAAAPVKMATLLGRINKKIDCNNSFDKNDSN